MTLLIVQKWCAPNVSGPLVVPNSLTPVPYVIISLLKNTLEQKTFRFTASPWYERIEYSTKDSSIVNNSEVVEQIKSTSNAPDRRVIFLDPDPDVGGDSSWISEHRSDTKPSIEADLRKGRVNFGPCGYDYYSVILLKDFGKPESEAKKIGKGGEGDFGVDGKVSAGVGAGAGGEAGKNHTEEKTEAPADSVIERDDGSKEATNYSILNSIRNLFSWIKAKLYSVLQWIWDFLGIS